MYNFSFICRASKIDKKGFAPIELSIIINGTRTYVILPMKFEPTLFNKMMASKRNGSLAGGVTEEVVCQSKKPFIATNYNFSNKKVSPLS